MDLPTSILRTFAHQSIDHVVWQPCIMYWYFGNNVARLTPATYTKAIQQFVPENYIGIDILDLLRDIKGSVRYPSQNLGLNSFYTQYSPDARIEKRSFTGSGGESVTTIKTPVGTVQETSKLTFPVEHYVKKIEDLDVIEYLLDHTEYCFNPYLHDGIAEEIAELGVVQWVVFRSPYQRCAIEFLGFITTTRFLRKYPQRMAQFIERLEAWDEKAYCVIAESPLQIVSFGENMHAKITPPPLFERYCLPYYKKRVQMLHAKGKYCHVHFDGDMKDLLPYFPELPFDGIEAVTCYPQGDITMEELAAVMGNKILLDGIPAVLFMREYSEKELENYTRRVLDLFAPRLILGISDELCPNMDGRRLKLVGNIAANYDIK